MKTIQCVLCVTLLFAARTSTATQVTPVLEAWKLPPDTQSSLQDAILTAQKKDPGVFAAVGRLAKAAHDLSVAARGGIANFDQPLEELGPPGTLALLQALVFQPLDRGTASDAEWQNFERAMLSVLGRLRDRTAEPVLLAILDDAGQPASRRSGAAEALCRIDRELHGGDLASRLAASPGEHETLLAGMRTCKSAVAAQAIRDVLDAKPDAGVARQAIAALTGVGNAAGWQALRDEKNPARSIATDALIDALMTYKSDLQEDASFGLRVVGHPDLEQRLLSRRSGASKGALAAIDRLLAELATPLRK